MVASRVVQAVAYDDELVRVGLGIFIAERIVFAAVKHSATALGTHSEAL